MYFLTAIWYCSSTFARVSWRATITLAYLSVDNNQVSCFIKGKSHNLLTSMMIRWRVWGSSRRLRWTLTIVADLPRFVAVKLNRYRVFVSCVRAFQSLDYNRGIYLKQTNPYNLTMPNNFVVLAESVFLVINWISDDLNQYNLCQDLHSWTL